MSTAQQSFSRAQPRGEEGAVLILLAIVLIPLLAVVGLAVDAGNLYRAQTTAQNAADATAIAMVNYVAMTGQWNVEEAAGARVSGAVPTALDVKREKMSTYLASHARNLVRANMEAAGLPHESDSYPVDVDFDYMPRGVPDTDPDAVFTVEVGVTRPVDFYIMDLVPQLGFRDGLVQATARAKREIANVGLVLDISSSMNCPAEGQCDCLLPNDIQCPASGRRWDVLLDSVTEFLKLFDMDNDRVALTIFNLAATTRSFDALLQEAGFEGRELSVRDLDLIIDYLRASFEPSGWTNICDAFMQNWAWLDQVARDEDSTTILFTDGSPNAGRFLYTAGAAKPLLQPTSTGFGQYDYISYSVAWVRDETKVNPGEREVFYAPSLPYATEVLSTGTEDLTITIDNPSAPTLLQADTFAGGHLPHCEGVFNTPTVSNAGHERSAPLQTLQPCLSSLEAHMPGRPGLVYHSENGQSQFEHWMQAYYHCAIQLSDFLRQSRSKVHVIGLGEKRSDTPANDPYADVFDNFHRKDVFNARLAADYQEALKNTTTDASGNTKIVEFTYQGYRSYAEVSADAETQGIYLPTHDARELTQIFITMARETILRLIG